MKKILPLTSVFVLALATWMIGRAGAASRCVPNKRFVVLSGRLVSDTLTNLVWQQNASSTTITWAAAQTYCPSGFRLPSLKELSSLLDLTGSSGPRIDQTAFPGTPADAFWTSSSDVGSSGKEWVVEFNNGGWYSVDVVNGYSRVRCVR